MFRRKMATLVLVMSWGVCGFLGCAGHEWEKALAMPIGQTTLGDMVEEALGRWQGDSDAGEVDGG